MSPAAVLAWVAVPAALTAALTRPLIGWLRARQLGKAIRADGPDHAAKAGTPTMGGLGLLAVIGGALLVVAGTGTTAFAAPLVAALLAFGAIGAMDDWLGLARKGRARELGVGLQARHLLLLQGLAAAGLATALARGIGPSGAAGIAWWLMAVAAILGTANGVNLSDGLDGLAAGLIALSFGALAVVLGLRGDPRAAAWCLAVAGASLGFLVWNRHPARVFMGNVTSMAVGAGLAVMALASGTWPILPVIGAVFVAEVLSDIVQVGYFRASGGRRILRCAPLHHHYEMGGMPETTVVRRFWLAGSAAALLGVALGAALLNG